MEIAQQWKNVSDLFYKVAKTGELKYVNEASKILLFLCYDAMEKLKNTTA